MRQGLLRVLVLVCALIPVTGSTLDLLCRIMRDAGPAHAAMIHPRAAASHAHHAGTGHHASTDEGVDRAAMHHAAVGGSGGHHGQPGHGSPDPADPTAPPCCATLGLPPIAPIAMAPVLPISRQTESARFWVRALGMTGHVAPPAAPPPRA